MAKSLNDYFPAATGGGSGAGIDELQLVNGSAPEFTTKDGRVYLRTGNPETLVSKYPNATVTEGGITGTSQSSVYNLYGNVTGNAVPVSSCYGGGYIWHLRGTNVYRYTTENIYTGFSFSVKSKATAPRGITFYNNRIWVIDNTTKRVFSFFTSNGQFNSYFSVNSSSNWDGIVYVSSVARFYAIRDNGYMYVHRNNGGYVTYYSNPGSVISSANDVTSDGTNIYYVYGRNLYIFNSGGGHLGTFDMTSAFTSNGSIYSAYYFGASICMVGRYTGTSSGGYPAYQLYEVKADSSGTVTQTRRQVIDYVEDPIAIAFDGTNYWILDSYRDFAVLVNASFVPNGTVIQHASKTTNATDVTWDGTHVVILASNGVAHRYLPNGTFVDSIDFKPTVQVTYGIAWDGTYWWVAGARTVYRLNADGTDSGHSFSFNPEVDPKDCGPLEYDGKQIWIKGRGVNDGAYKYTTSGSYSGVTMAAQPRQCWGVCWDGNRLYVLYENATYYYWHSVRSYTVTTTQDYVGTVDPVLDGAGNVYYVRVA